MNKFDDQYPPVEDSDGMSQESSTERRVLHLAEVEEWLLAMQHLRELEEFCNLYHISLEFAKNSVLVKQFVDLANKIFR